MQDARRIIDMYYPEMRWRTLSLAADLDRISRAAGGAELLKTDPALCALRQCVAVLLDDQPDRAERVQQILSDHSPPPPR